MLLQESTRSTLLQSQRQSQVIDHHFLPKLFLQSLVRHSLLTLLLQSLPDRAFKSCQLELLDYLDHHPSLIRQFLDLHQCQSELIRRLHYHLQLSIPARMVMHCTDLPPDLNRCFLRSD